MSETVDIENGDDNVGTGILGPELQGLFRPLHEQGTVGQFGEM